MPSETLPPDYTAYILAVYLIAAVTYGGLVLLWQLQCRRLERQLREATNDPSHATRESSHS